MTHISRTFVSFLKTVDTPEREDPFIRRAAAAFSLCEAWQLFAVRRCAVPRCHLFWQAVAEADLLSFEVSHVPAEYTVTEQGQPSPGRLQFHLLTLAPGAVSCFGRLARLHDSRSRQGHGELSEASRNQHR